MNPDDERLARIARALRRRAGLTQRDLARDGLSVHFIRAMEAGDIGRLRVGQVREHFARLDARAKLTIWAHGADVDRLLDERHALVVETGASIVRSYGWQLFNEITFSEYGERGSIDLFAADQANSAVFVGEAKSAWGSIEETNRSLDVKARLAPKVTADRFGWRPRHVAKVLMFPDDSTARRVASRFDVTLSGTYPARAREIRSWLRKPQGSLAGLWFLSNVQ